MTVPVIEISAMSKDYHGLRPLRIERLTVSEGESVAIVGLDEPMAETLINLVTGAALPDAGAVTIFGKPTDTIADSAEWLRLVDRLGIVSARAVLLETLSVAQNLAIPFGLDIEPPPPDVLARVAALAGEAGLPDKLLACPIGDLGPPERVRVHVARAIAHDPRVLVLDHASAGLAPDAAAALGADIRRLALGRRCALLAATADARFAVSVCERVLTHEAATGRLAPRRGGLLGRIFGS